jgi:hypothetical protein
MAHYWLSAVYPMGYRRCMRLETCIHLR